MGSKKSIILIMLLLSSLMIFAACTNDLVSQSPYNISGEITTGVDIVDVSEITISISGVETDMSVTTDSSGKWLATEILGPVTVEPVDDRYDFYLTSDSNQQSKRVSSANNNIDFELVLERPIISGDQPGTYPLGEYLTIELSYLDDYEIYYTLDGSDPTVESSSYDEAITINEDTTLKAIAINEAGDESEVLIAEYEFSEFQIDAAAHYTLDGNLEDETGSFAVGTITGDQLDNEGGTITYAPGVRDGSEAAQFGGDSGIRLPDGLIEGNEYSVSFWLKPSQLTNFTTTFFGAETTDHWVSFVPETGDESRLWSGSQDWYDGNIDRIAVDEWTHIAFSVDEGEVKLYVNGDLEHEGSSFPDVFTSNSAEFALGVNYWDTPYQGMIDELVIFDRAVSEETIDGLYELIY